MDKHLGKDLFIPGTSILAQDTTGLHFQGGELSPVTICFAPQRSRRGAGGAASGVGPGRQEDRVLGEGHLGGNEITFWTGAAGGGASQGGARNGQKVCSLCKTLHKPDLLTCIHKVLSATPFLAGDVCFCSGSFGLF